MRFNTLRIIAGKWRGRKVSFMDSPGLRPTPNRVKETLFNWLAPIIHGAVCLDIFAGSGSLGFESLSRGAQKIIFVELSREVIQKLTENCKILQCEDNVELLQMRSEDYLQKTTGTFDVIFLDPPYHHQLIAPCIECIHQRNLLNSNGYLYIESEYKITEHDIPADWQLLKQKKAGQVHYHLIMKP